MIKGCRVLSVLFCGSQREKDRVEGRYSPSNSLTLGLNCRVPDWPPLLIKFPIDIWLVPEGSSLVSVTKRHLSNRTRVGF